MAVRHYRDLIAWQMAAAFKKEVFRLLRTSGEARRNLRYRDQLIEAAGAVASDIAEGFLRVSPAECCRFLDYALGSLVEAEGRLEDGIDLGYFEADECQTAFRLGRRCLTATVGFKKSQQRYMKDKPKPPGKNGKKSLRKEDER